MNPDVRPGGGRASSFLPHFSRVSARAGLALCMGILLVVTAGPRAAAEAPRIVMDGEFDDWVDRTHLEDAPEHEGAEYDVHVLHWGTNPDESFMYFMVERYPPDAWAPGVKYSSGDACS